MSIERLSGGLTPADGSDPRTFPAIFNNVADTIESQGSAIAAAESDIDSLQSNVTANGTAITGLGSNVFTLQNDLDQVESDIDTLQADLSTAESDIDTLEAKNLPAFSAVAPTDGQVPVFDAAGGVFVPGAGGGYSQENILGTVSQTSGVPTGAIIETDTNANGTFVKYADGTMVCFSLRAGVTITTGTDITFPATFVDTTYVVMPNHEQSLDRVLAIVGGSLKTTSTFRMRVQDTSATFGSVTDPTFIAFGRWF